ncbi:MAG: hypothetical protein CSA62_03790 [Planctomycetota bacterium]|nr:MAG: hypothetical protein CSA62_03790 [Planctomycetota bacterium]
MAPALCLSQDGHVRRFSIISLVFLVICLLFLRPGQPVRSGPIVHQVSENSAVILVHGEASGRRELSVEVADATGPVGKRLLPSGSPERSTFRLTGLEAGTQYRYQLYDNGKIVGKGGFRTAPPAGTGSLRFVAFGDTGDLPWWGFMLDGPIRLSSLGKGLVGHHPAQWAVGRDAAALAPEVFLHLGDVVYPRGEWRHYEVTTFAPFAELFANCDVHVTIGNHDAMTENGAPMFRAFELPIRKGGKDSFYYEFVHGPVHFFNVASYGVSFAKGSEQRRWFEEHLRASKSPWKVVFTHRPLWSASRSRKARTSVQWRKDLHPFLAEQGVRLFLSGHDHTYQRYKERDGVNYVIAGGGGKSLYDMVEDENLAKKAKRFSYVIVDATPERLLLQARDLHGVIFDTCELRR